jgi:hypothetical protein
MCLSGFSTSERILVPVTEINYRCYVVLGYPLPVTDIIISANEKKIVVPVAEIVVE